ncbi:MAG: class I SAM-dependent methyltransferase [Gammaproteobacteria bacterium]|nr:class I SAM-dependent methyltransferase [Gammaproteobacteria bacterium]
MFEEKEVGDLFRMQCKICQNAIQPFMNFGKMPLANGFLLPSQFQHEYFYELMPAFCDECAVFQIAYQPKPEKMFTSSYPFFSRTSQAMREHFKQFAHSAMCEYLKGREDPFIVELGSNDGILLEHFAQNKVKHLGIEPSSNTAEVAMAHGVRTLIRFFSKELANEIVSAEGHADVVLSANVVCHIANLQEVAEGLQKLLKPDGFFIFEDPYLGDMIQKTSYDQIYDEHVYIFSLQAVQNIFGRLGFKLVDAMPQPTHGGSMRYVLVKKESSVKPDARVKQYLEAEHQQKLHLVETYLAFKQNCERSRQKLVMALEAHKKYGKRVIGYAATSKSTTILNYCNIGPTLIEFICDTTPLKQGRYSPGMHIPVKPHSDFLKQYPDLAVLFAWNHQKEIFEKEKNFVKVGGKWLLPL